MRTDRHKLSRRDFLKISGSLAIGAALSSVPAWLRAAARDGASGKTLVVLFQRGAADGLNILVPYKDPNYRKARPTIGIPEPGKYRGALDLDGAFGFHPNLAPLLPFWKEGRLGAVQAVGSTEHATRSHFDAQDDMETGTPGLKSTADGWLNRALSLSTVGKPGPLTALSLSPRLPRILRGDFPVSSMPEAAGYKFNQGGGTEDSFGMLYEKNMDSLLSGAGKETTESVKQIRDLLSKPSPSSENAGYTQGGLGKGLADLARLIKAGAGLRVAFVDLGGWDHHSGEDYRLNELMGETGTNLAAFFKDLGDRGGDVLLVTLTEFGRTLRENGARGTDHGSGGLMFVMGGKVRGGRIHGKWPGLELENLVDGRDLRTTTDYRQVMSELLSKHLEVKNQASIFPAFKPGPNLGLL